MFGYNREIKKTKFAKHAAILKTFLSISEFKSNKKTIITIGTFDGIHIGHQKILKKLVQQGREKNLDTVLLSFFPHPRMVLKQNEGIKLLNTVDEKSKLLALNGIDNLIIHPFDKKFSALSPEEFVKNYLVDQLGISKIIIGYDHRFGKNRTAGIADLIQFGLQYNFEVEQITVAEIDAISVSSTKIREAIADGAIDKANSYLGYRYFFSGKVVTGDQIGRTIGFPTANLILQESYKLVPKSGVFLIIATYKETNFRGLMNIGTRPTLNGREKKIEVHLLDFSGNLYHETLTITLIDKIREEIKFDSLDHLRSQLQQDKTTAISYFQNFSVSLLDFIF